MIMRRNFHFRSKAQMEGKAADLAGIRAVSSWSKAYLTIDLLFFYMTSETKGLPVLAAWLLGSSTPSSKNIKTILIM
jgi:hypothetical protein